jgi:peptidyl-tRNA hydrolase
LTYYTISGQLDYLIAAAYNTYNEKVVVIVDEYDKPLLDTINNKEIHENLKNELRGFYAEWERRGGIGADREPGIPVALGRDHD